MKVKRRIEVSPEFIEFWKVWQPHMRHTDGRGAAFEAFDAYVKAGYDPQDIIDGARCQIRILKEAGEMTYIPLVKTWLNRIGFEELAARERTFQARQAELKSAQSVQPVKIKKPHHHFSLQWERGEIQGNA